MGKRDSLLIKADSLFCKGYNAGVYLKSALKQDKELLKNNLALRNTDNNGICFVIGNGPSLKSVDLGSIKDYCSITVNGFYLGNTDFNSTYHLFYDEVYINKAQEHITASMKNSDLKYIANIINKNAIRSIVGKDRDIYTISAGYTLSGREIRYDMTKEMTGSINVIPVAIECAMYMGFKTICLLGCDFSLYTKVNGAHFYNDTVEVKVNKEDFTKNSVGNLIRCALVHKQHYCIEAAARKAGIKILNATTDSLIDAYDFIKLDELLSDTKA